jgi:uncharacterized SAM-binding protein YcdF (DUF218 family)
VSLRTKAILAVVAAGSLLVGLAALERALAPAGNTNAARFDAIIILGASLDRDGHPTPILQSRIAEGVHEYERGVAAHIIVTGAESHGFSQAAAMARTAEAQGIPASSIVQEPQANDTIQNACLSERIMKERGWQTAEVITSPSHLQRSNLIFSRYPLAWRGHAAPPLSSADTFWYDGPVEVLKTARYIAYAQWTESCQP